MKSFEEISKMNLADLDRTDGVSEEDETVQDVAGQEEAQNAENVQSIEEIQGADETADREEKAEESKESEESEEKATAEESEEPAQPEELAKKEMMEPQGKHFRVDAEITQQELTAFLFGHTYRQPLMILVTILAIAWPVAVLVKKQGSITMPLICSLFILIWIPLTTYLRAKNAKKLNTAYQHTFHYMLDEWGLHLELGDDAIDVEWKKVTKMIFYKSVAVIYTGKNNAFLIPSAAMGAQRQEIISFIEEMKKR